MRFKVRDVPSVAVIVMVSGLCLFDMDEVTQLLYRSRLLLLLIAAFLLPVIPSHDMNGHINETMRSLDTVRFALLPRKMYGRMFFRGVVGTCNESSLSFEGHERSLLYDIL